MRSSKTNGVHVRVVGRDSHGEIDSASADGGDTGREDACHAKNESGEKVGVMMVVVPERVIV